MIVCLICICIFLFSYTGNITGAQAASFSRQGSMYHVETRARVIILDIATFEAESTLQRRSSSLVPHSVDHLPRFLSREHGGLMSWPEHFYKRRQHDQKLEEPHRKVNSLSARAMQLNIFGSMVSYICSLLFMVYWTYLISELLNIYDFELLRHCASHQSAYKRKRE